MSTQDTTRLASSTGSENSHTPVATSIDHEKEGHLEQVHPGGALGDQGGEDHAGAHQQAHPDHAQRQHGELYRLPAGSSGLKRAQAAKGEGGGNVGDGAHEPGPEGGGGRPGEGHRGSAELAGRYRSGQTQKQRDQAAENQRGPVEAEDLEEFIGLAEHPEAPIDVGLLDADQHSEGESQTREEQGKDDVEATDYLVIPGAENASETGGRGPLRGPTTGSPASTRRLPRPPLFLASSQ